MSYEAEVDGCSLSEFVSLFQTPKEYMKSLVKSPLSGNALPDNLLRKALNERDVPKKKSQALVVLRQSDDEAYAVIGRRRSGNFIFGKYLGTHITARPFGDGLQLTFESNIERYRTRAIIMTVFSYFLAFFPGLVSTGFYMFQRVYRHPRQQELIEDRIAPAVQSALVEERARVRSKTPQRQT